MPRILLLAALLAVSGCSFLTAREDLHAEVSIDFHDEDVESVTYMVTVEPNAAVSLTVVDRGNELLRIDDTVGMHLVTAYRWPYPSGNSITATVSGGEESSPWRPAMCRQCSRSAA